MLEASVLRSGVFVVNVLPDSCYIPLLGKLVDTCWLIICCCIGVCILFVSSLLEMSKDNLCVCVRVCACMHVYMCVHAFEHVFELVFMLRGRVCLYVWVSVCVHQKMKRDGLTELFSHRKSLQGHTHRIHCLPGEFALEDGF